MTLEEQFRCKGVKCEGVLIIPIKLVRKGGLVTVLSLCPKCRRKYKGYLQMNERDNWIPLIRTLFLRCEVCGELLPNNWRYAGTSISGVSMSAGRHIRLANPCPNCKRNDLKAVNELLWDFINPNPPPPPSQPIYIQPSSSMTVAPPVSVPSIKYCSSCGSPVEPNTLFCKNCGTQQ